MTAKPESKQPIKLTSKVNSFTEVQKSLQEAQLHPHQINLIMEPLLGTHLMLMEAH